MATGRIEFGLSKKENKNMDGFVKTLGVLMVLVFFVPAALIKFLWLYLVA